jgi:hypothetical protein
MELPKFITSTFLKKKNASEKTNVTFDKEEDEVRT